MRTYVRMARRTLPVSSQPLLPLNIPSCTTGMIRDVSKPSVVSLYSGAGGLDLGFIEAGFEIVFANDSDPFAVETYRRNIGEHAVCGDVLHTPLPEIQPDVLIGGPPCQGFSVIGKMDRNDPRSKHVLHFMDAVDELRPQAFVMENVKALYDGPRWELLRRDLHERAEELGYATELILLNAADFGVPQARQRMFFIGLRGETRPLIPVPTSAGKPKTVREVLATLPAFGEAGNNTFTGARVVPSRLPIMRPTAHTGSLLFNGSGRPLHLDRPAKTLPASMGGNATPIVDQEELDRGAAPWVVEYHQHLLNGGAPLTEAPSRLRRITVEEAAALQTFPRSHKFAGQKVAQYRQIGNAVPPKLAEAVAQSVMKSINQRQTALSAGAV